MDPFVCAAEGAQPGFNALHQPERQTALLAAGTPADQAVCADPGQGLVE